MSMPISKTILLVLGCLALANCRGIELGGSVEQAVSVASGAVTISGPRGYCIDKRLSRLQGEAFVAMGSCAAISRGASGPVGTPGVLTATVASNPLTVSPPLEDLETFLTSPAGRSALSRSGQAESVEVEASEVQNDILYLTIRDTAPTKDGETVDPVYRRAVFALNGHLVTATVMSFAEQPLSADARNTLLLQFVNHLQTTNEAS